MRKIKKSCMTLTTLDKVDSISLLKMVHLVIKLDGFYNKACLFYNIPNIGIIHSKEDTISALSKLYHDNVRKGVIEPSDNYSIEYIDHSLSGKYKHKKVYNELKINKLTDMNVCDIIFPAHDIWVEYFKDPYIITYKNETTEELDIYDMIRKVLNIYFSQDGIDKNICNYVSRVEDTLHIKNII